MKKTMEQRFWAKVEKSDGCWTWTAALTSSGYGVFGAYGSTAMKAHRVSWCIEHGEMPPADLLVCHHCDNRKCVRPSHLFLGTHQDNMTDRNAKGRQYHGRMHHSARLVTHNGKTMCVTEWAAEVGLSRDSLKQRLNKGWSVDRALSTPRQENQFG